MSRLAARIELTDAEKEELQRRARAHSVAHRDRQRAKVILLSSEGLENQEIAEKLRLSRLAVGKWRERFSLERMAGLIDAPGRGRLSNLAPAQIAAVLSRVVQPPAHLQRWSCRSMAQEVGVSKSTVQKLWASNDLRPHLSRTFKLSSDPEFEVKFWDVIGLYLNPPEKAVVLCCDEKSQIQALQRSQPGCRWAKGISAPKPTITTATVRSPSLPRWIICRAKSSLTPLKNNLVWQIRKRLS